MPNDQPAKPPTPDSVEPDSAGGWFRAMRRREALELLQANPCAFILAYIIAFRGQYNPGFNKHGLALGEALLGDFKNYGMTQQQYRTAKRQLAKWQFATFRATSKGSVGRLIDSRVFSIFRLASNKQNNEQLTSKQRAANERLTTTKNIRAEEHEEHKGGAPRKKALNPSERISAEKEREDIAAELKTIRNQASEDAFGPKYDDLEREHIRELKQRDKALAEALRVQL